MYTPKTPNVFWTKNNEEQYTANIWGKPCIIKYHDGLPRLLVYLVDNHLPVGIPLPQTDDTEFLLNSATEKAYRFMTTGFADPKPKQIHPKAKEALLEQRETLRNKHNELSDMPISAFADISEIAHAKGVIEGIKWAMDEIDRTLMT